MGNFVFGACRGKRKQARSEFQDEYEEKRIESEIYLPGSLDYLERLGMDRFGRIKDKNSDLLDAQNMQAVFDDYCDNMLDLDNAQNYIGSNGRVNFNYFLRVYKTGFLWKKIKFARKRVQFIEKRRGFLYQKQHELYEKTCDMM